MKLFILIVVILVSLAPAAAQEVLPAVGGELAWNPDGTELAIVAENGIFIYAGQMVI